MDLEPPSRILTCLVHGSDISVPIWEKGQGNTLLMLHGWGLDHTSLHLLREQLAPSFRVVSVDLPGFGQATLPPPIPASAPGDKPSASQGWGVPEYCQLVKGLIQQLAPSEPVIVLGHSFGGRIGMHLAAHYPEQVNALILVASAGLRKPVSLVRRMQLRVLRILGKGAQLLLPASVAEPLRLALVRRMASRDYLAAGPLRSTLVRVVNENAAAYASAIEAPTLLIWGEKDRETPPWIGKALQALIPHASLCLLPELDHHSILTEGRFQVAYQIRRHLRKSCSRGSQTDPSISLQQT